MSTETMRATATALADRELSRAVEDFIAADHASRKAMAALTPAQASGPDPVPPQVAYLCDEAQHCWDLLAEGWAENLIPAYVRKIGRDYARPKIVHTPVAMDWSALDWSRGR